MALLLLRLWPALIPILMYMLWHHQRKKAHLAEGKEPPAFFDGPWMRAFATALAIAVLMLIFWRLLEPNHKGGAYEPAHMENGKLVKGEMHAKP